MNVLSFESKSYAVAQWVLPIDRPPIEMGFVAFKDGKLSDIGSISDLPDPIRQALSEHIDEASRLNTLLTPGLVNTHTHIEQSFGMLIESSDSMADWLARAKAVLDERLKSPEDISLATRQGIQELLSTGTTCVNDINRTGFVLPILKHAGIRAIVSLEFFHPDAQALNQNALDDLIEKFKLLQDAYDGDGMLEVGLAPHSPYNVSPKSWQYVVERCQDWMHQQNRRLTVHAHLAESADETLYLSGQASGIPEMHERFLGRTYTPEYMATSPVRYFEAAGLLDTRLIAVHCVFTDAEDRKLLADHGVTVSHCPRSNQYLQGKTLKWHEWKESGVTIGLGTDGHFSTPTLDVRDDARLTMQIHHISAKEALTLITREGARVMRLAEEIGTLTPGKNADWVLWEPATAEWGFSPEAQVLSARTSVRTSMVNGQPVYVKEGVRAGV